MLIIHGGGWVGGDKRAKREQNIGTNLAQAGYVCASINYILAEKKEVNFAKHLGTVWPQHLHDCKTAVRWLRKHAGVYKIDSERIGVIGGSAGGHLTAMVGLTGADDKLDPAGRYNEYSCRVQAIVPMYGAHDLIARSREKGLLDEMTAGERKLCRDASPITYSSSDDPPTLILHGTADATVPVGQSELLDQALRKAKVDVELVIVEGAPQGEAEAQLLEVLAGLDPRPLADDEADHVARLQVLAQRLHGVLDRRQRELGREQDDPDGRRAGRE